MERVARHVFVSGRVQGVGFRWFVRRLALEVGVNGWVRNLSDGRVEAWIEGSEDAVATMLERLRGAKSPARVDDVEVLSHEALGLAAFEIHHGA
jgi:acylphosphatase